jgi:hypothetical protein
MTRFSSILLCSVLSIGLLACGSNATTDGAGGSGQGGAAPGSGGAAGGPGGGTGGAAGAVTAPKTALDAIPGNNAVSGWTIDPDNGKTASLPAATATTETDTEALIDGAAADFFAAPNNPKTFAWQNYVNSTVKDAPTGATVVLYVLEMPSAEQAAGLYASLRSAALYSRKKGTPDDWQDPTTPLVGTASRIQNSGDTWWINFHKGNFYVEVNLMPSQGPAPDYNPGNENTKAEAFRFAQAVASRI